MLTVKRQTRPREPLPPRPTTGWVWERDQKLQALGFDDYADYIHSTAWYEVRKRYQASSRPQDCQLCGSTERIQLHHRTYERVGAEQLGDLVPLCPPCHGLVHALQKRGDIEAFDLEQIRSLVDTDRAEENRPVEAERVGRQRGQYRELHLNETLRSTTRMQRLRLKDLVHRAHRKGVDISAELAAVDVAIDAIERKVR